MNVTSDELQLLNRALLQVTVTDDGCWRWDGSLTSTGYGRIGHGGRVENGGTRERAHRVTYRLLRGPIPEGTELDHLCRNTRCVNPEHLEPVSHRVNIQRGYGTETHCRHGHERTPENTYTAPSGGRTCRLCTRKLDRERKRAIRKREGGDVNGCP